MTVWKTLARLQVVALSIVLSGCVVGEFVNYAATAGSGRFERRAKQRDLEKVARDWCLTIRASQVIPVYPMDEDVEVGDIYIVDTPIEKLKQYWNNDGYLPIDHRFARLPQKGYQKYYHGRGYAIEDGSVVPRNWQFPARSAAAEFPLGKDDGFKLTDWPRAPRAAFPTYSFNIRRGEGFNGALPVQGIPVSLSALSAREAKGSVTLSDSYTYGIDEPSITDSVLKWAGTDTVRANLKDYATQGDPKHPTVNVKPKTFIRVVTRVYLVRGVTVNLTNTEASAWKTSVGAPKGAEQNLSFGEKKDEKGNKVVQAEDELLKKVNENSSTQALKTDTANAATPNAPLGAADGTFTPTPYVEPDPKPEVGSPEAFLEARKKAVSEAEEEYALDLRRKAIKERQLQDTVNDATFKSALERTLQKNKFGGYVLPGGTLQVASASERSISMNETFTRPLVVGFHALEFAIRGDGSLHPEPVSTFNRLETGIEPVGVYNVKLTSEGAAIRRFMLGNEANMQFVQKWINENPMPEGYDAVEFATVGDPIYQREFIDFARQHGKHIE